MRNEIKNLRNELLNSLPSGELRHSEMSSIELLKIIDKHISQLDNLIDKTTCNNLSCPSWLSSEDMEKIRVLWNLENINHSNPRVEAVKYLQKICEERTDRVITITKATQIIKDNCLINV